MVSANQQKSDRNSFMTFNDVRSNVLATCRTLADRGFLAGTGGNVALRADAEHFAVTPSATDYYTMSMNDVCVIRFADMEQTAGDLAPSVESGLHARFLLARPDCDASVHTHQPIASAYTLFAKPLEVRSAEHRDLLGSLVPCAGYAPSGTSWLAGKVAKLARNNVHAYLMRNHGVVCLGADADQAIERVEALEAACAEYFTRQLEKHPDSLPEAVVEAVRAAMV
jgi:L-fuculose-phosphate aldolase